MNFREYHDAAMVTKTYPQESSLWLTYPTLGLVGEAGEVANKVKKIFRDKQGQVSEEDKAKIADELGDCLWYVAAICDDLNLDMSAIAENNIAKLRDRKERGVIKGNGDNR